ncbi:MAG TPA: sigma-70 family RNA polymerase sigma factor [Polyangiaceae bacterium]
MDHPALAVVFSAAGGKALESDAALDAALAARWDAARLAWPSLALEPAPFVTHLARLAGAAGQLPPLEHTGDLFLAFACAAGASGALQAFEALFAAHLHRAAARVNATDADLVVQRVRERLLLATPEHPPKIAEFAGRAKLSSWLAAVCAREGLNARRRMDDRAHDSLSAVATAAATTEPEIALLRQRHAADFRDSIRAALVRLEPRDRALLRMNLAVGLSIDRVAEVYKISRATAARWLAAARQALQKETYKELTTRLGVSPSELESVAAAIRSEIDLSVGALLAETKG